MTKTWQDYERELAEHLVCEYQGATIQHNVKLRGHKSTVDRQIDVLVTEDVGGGLTVRTAYDAKFRGRPVDIGLVESFIGQLEDVGVDRGVMISREGFTSGALERAFRDDVDIDLDVLSLDEFLSLQGAGAIPYAGGNGVMLRAPLGWAVDATRRPGFVAGLWRKGWTFENALQAREFMYVNFWNRENGGDLDALLREQEASIRRHDPKACILLRELDGTRGTRATIRRAVSANSPCPEITGLVEFERFIFFVVLHTLEQTERRNVRKLERILRLVLPMGIR